MSYPHVVLTSDRPWDPHNVILGSVSRSEEEEKADTIEKEQTPEDPDYGMYYNHEALLNQLNTSI
jgi:hypothetical protein